MGCIRLIFQIVVVIGLIFWFFGNRRGGNHGKSQRADFFGVWRGCRSGIGENPGPANSQLIEAEVI